MENCNLSEASDESGAEDNKSFISRPGHPFPKKVQSILESLYNKGMTGWGAKHTAAIEVAIQSTGLSDAQIKV